MIKEHWVFICLMSFLILTVIAITMRGLNHPTGSHYCIPLDCRQMGLEPGGFHCDEHRCYRDCFQNGTLIERATFCEK